METKHRMWKNNRIMTSTLLHRQLMLEAKKDKFSDSLNWAKVEKVYSVSCE